MDLEKERSEAEDHDRLSRVLWFGNERTISHCVHMKKEHSALSSTPRMWETKDGSRPSWMMLGTPSARLMTRASKDYKELHQAVKSQKSDENRKAKALWALKEAKDHGIDVFDLGNVKKIPTRSDVKLDLWAIHWKGPSAALPKALACLEQGDSAPPLTSER